MDFEEEEEEEEGNEEGWVLEPQEGGVGSMEGPDDSEVTFALHSGRSPRRSIINSGQAGARASRPEGTAGPGLEELRGRGQCDGVAESMAPGVS